MPELVPLVVNGILLGSLYAVVGIGLSIVFGIMRKINLAHGDLIVLSSYLGFVISSIFGVHPLLTLVLVAPALFLLGMALQAALLNRVIKEGAEPSLIITFGLSVIIQNGLRLVFTPDARSLAGPTSASKLDLGPISLPTIYFLDLLVSLAVLGMLAWFLHRTYLGRAIRAASDDDLAAALLGVDIRRVYAYAMGVAALTAAVAGILLGMTFVFYPSSGPQYLIIAFAVVVIGGLGNIAGTFLGGALLGIAQVVGAHFLGAGYQLLVGYLVILVMLALRPEGLLARRL